MPEEKQKANERKAEFNRANYIRFLVTVPKGYQNEIKRRADQIGLSVNAYIIGLIRADMDAAETGNGRED